MNRTRFATPWPGPPPLDRQPGRREGLRTGFWISGALVTVAMLIMAIAGTPVETLALGLAQIGGPTLLAGTITGWMLGPTAWRACTTRDRLVVSLAMSIYATAIGDAGVSFAIGLAGDGGPLGLIGTVIQALAGILLIWPIGLLMFGAFFVPLTFGAGLIWTDRMIHLAERPLRSASPR